MPSFPRLVIACKLDDVWFGRKGMTSISRTRPLIVGLGGTTRLNSSSQKALKVALRAAADAGAETMAFGGAQLKFPMYEQGEVVRTAGVKRYLGLLRRSQGVIIASPGYHGALSGLVKNALDYIEDLRDSSPPYLDGRAVGCISCALGWQTAAMTLVTMRSIVHALRGWPTPMGAALNTASPIFDDAGACVDTSAKFQLELIGRQVVEFACMRADALADTGCGSRTSKKGEASR